MILCEYTPCFKPLLNRYDVTYASVYGAVWRYCQGNKHICTATIAAIAERAGVSGAVVASRLNVLEEDGWIESKKVCTKVGWRRVMHLVLNAATMKEEPEEINVDEIEWQHPDAFETPSTEGEDTTPAMVTHPLESVDSPPPEQKKESIEESIEESSKKNCGDATFEICPTPASKELFACYRRKRWNTDYQRDEFLSCEKEVGTEIMLEAVHWAASSDGIKYPIKSIMTRARNIAKERNNPGGRRQKKRTESDPDSPFAEGNYYDHLADIIDENPEFFEEYEDA
jgi:DNA-binding Lrp family transcriptional regulator